MNASGGKQMGRKSHSKESIIQILQNLAKRLGKKYLSKRDIQSEISESSIGYHFGSLGNALEAAGLERKLPGENLKELWNKLSEDDLFLSMLEVERSLGREPTINEYNSLGKYSNNPFKKRFGKWPDVLSYYRKWKSSKGPQLADMKLEDYQASKDAMSIQPLNTESKNITLGRSSGNPAQLYGEPIDFRGLRHAPINEQGVVYLFGMVSRELGFYIEAIQQGFPDCEGKYLHDSKKNLWAKARIEFEFKASNFQEHGHDPNQCDFIVCWINDWPDCPITVIELRKEILKLAH
jgi:hypothetical protein